MPSNRHALPCSSSDSSLPSSSLGADVSLRSSASAGDASFAGSEAESGANAFDILGAARPDDAGKTAIVFHERQFTFGELRDDVAQDSPAACTPEPGAGRFAGHLPAQLPGTSLPLHGLFQNGRRSDAAVRRHEMAGVREILEHSGVEVLVASPHLPIFTCTNSWGFLASGSVSSVRTLHCCRSARTHVRMAVRNLAGGAKAAGLLAPRSHSAQPVESSPDRLAAVLHTSGSHGHAKGVMLSRSNVEHILEYRLAHTCSHRAERVRHRFVPDPERRFLSKPRAVGSRRHDHPARILRHGEDGRSHQSLSPDSPHYGRGCIRPAAASRVHFGGELAVCVLRQRRGGSCHRARPEAYPSSSPAVRCASPTGSRNPVGPW